jgi:catechol 2,3-dioxygenase-like lactoylglutathione lyase family enzyme
MIGYVTIGTNDLARAAAFYDALLGEVGAKRMMENDQFIAWSVRPDAPGLGVTKPFDKKPATVGNGVMVALEAASTTQGRCAASQGHAIGRQGRRSAGTSGRGFLCGVLSRSGRQQVEFFLHGLGN